MPRLLALVASACFVAGLVGCGGSSEDPSDGGVILDDRGMVVGDIEIIRFTASEEAVPPNGTVELIWEVRGARTVEIGTEDTTLVSTFGGTGRVTTGFLRNTKRFTLTARDGAESATASVEVIVDWPKPVIVNFDVSPQATVIGSFVSIFWGTSNADEIRLLRNGVEIARLTSMLESGGISSLVSDAETVFRIEAINPDETESREITVRAEAPPTITRFTVEPMVFFSDTVTATITWETANATRTDLDIDFNPVRDFPNTASGVFNLQLVNTFQQIHLTASSQVGATDVYVRIQPPAREIEPNGTSDRAQQLFEVYGVVGELSSALDVDIYSIFPPFGAKLRLRTTGLDGTGCATDTQLVFSNTAMQELASDSSDGAPAMVGSCAELDAERDVALTDLVDGMYFVTVRGEESQRGDYVLIIEYL